MTLPVQMFPMLTPAQISPMMTGIEQANQLYAQTMSNRYLQPNLQAALQKQQISNQISQAQANVAPQMNAAQLAYARAKVPNLDANTSLIMSGQLPQAQANANLLNTDAQKNTWFLNNPETMLPGMAGQLGGLALLKNIMDAQNMRGSAPPRPTPNISYGQIPAMPSAGNDFSQPANVGGQILPPNAYGLGDNSSSPQSVAPSVSQQQGIGNGGIPFRLPLGQQINPQGGQSFNGMPLDQDGLPNTQDLMKFGLQSILAPMQKNIAQADYYQTKASGYNFQSLPPAEKSYTIAQVAGMGIDPMQAAKLLNNGQTVSSIAQSRGLNPNDLPTPLYAATPGTIQLIQRRNQALNEINTIQPQITSAMAPYSRQFAGYSPSQIASAIKGDNADQQARFLAARALLPEMASLRLKAMGGNIGIEAIKEVNNQSMGNIKSFQGLVSPKVYSNAQNYVDDWINQGANAANKVGLAGSVGNLNNGGKPLSNATMTGGASPPVNSMVSMRAPNGEAFTIPAANVQAAIKMGATQE